MPTFVMQSVSLSTSKPKMPLKHPMKNNLSSASKLYGLILGLGTLLLYAPVMFFQFIYYDDNAYVFENPYVRSGLSSEFFRWNLTANIWGNWHPLTMLSHALDWQLFGAWAGGHHLISALFHAINAILIFILFSRMTGSTGKSFFLAAIFAWHPVAVESVAWIAERKDVLSTFFVLLAILNYVKATSGNLFQKKAFIASCAFLVLSLLCKPMYITLPAILLIFDFWPLARKDKNFFGLILEKIPYVIIVIIFTLIAFRYQATSGAIQTFADFPFLVRIANLAQSYFDYILLYLWPAKLSIFYPYIPNTHVFLSLAIAVAMAALTLTLFIRRKLNPEAWVGWCLFGICMVPVIGIVKLGAHWIACRYLYWPATGLSILLLWLGEKLLKELRVPVKMQMLCGVLILMGFATVTSNYLSKWRNSYTLFEHAVKTVPNNWVAHINLRAAYGRDGDPEKAAEHYLEAMRIFPGVTERIPPNWIDFYYLGKLNWQAGKIDQARSFLGASENLLKKIDPQNLEEKNKSLRDNLMRCIQAAKTKNLKSCSFQ